MMNETLYLNNTLNDWLISAGIIVGALIINKLIVLLNKHVIRKITRRTQGKVDDILFEMLQAPVLFGILLAAIWIAVERLDLNEQLQLIVDKSYRILIVINITWFISRLTRSLIEELWINKPQDENNPKRMEIHVIILIRKIITTIIWLLGMVFALHNAGYQVSALLGTLGIGGLAFAFAAQDTLKNVFGGFTVFADKPFKIGDRIVVDGNDGFVEDIGIRSTRIRTLERKLVIIPNSKISDASIENISAEPMRRILLKLGLNYDTPPEKMKEALEILRNLPKKIKLIDKNDCFVFFSDFAASSLEITLIYFIKKESDILDSINKVNMEILESFNAAGLEFAFPTQTIHLANQPLP
jgi:MscS family membrane protein